ncbi:hypothetical protein PYW08_013177 [Mythimna loreyi]|uniref:Uncharacterized protein n=1 Tax=Mythimna loreyi TaxID=667449 RepID=A0ACC2QG09_9NEOP|nr:hypothetical protein PYW08_013177 [Mythimna loreyi]
MFLILFCLILIYFPFNNGVEIISDTDLYRTLFGDIGSMQDLFLNESDDQPPTSRNADPTRRDSDPTRSDSNTTRRDSNTTRRASEPVDENDDFEALELPNLFDFNRANLPNHTFDMEDFITIDEQYSNFSKEYKNFGIKKPMRNQTRDELKNKTRRSWDDPDDYWHGESIEEYKRQRFVMVLAQFALHCRYEVGKALLHRDLIRHDKRYKLGYLFNRMRRLKTEQLKQIGAAWRRNHDFDRADVLALMRSYERVVHFDVDMRDTANLIKMIYNKDEPYDYFVTKGKA